MQAVKTVMRLRVKLEEALFSFMSFALDLRLKDGWCEPHKRHCVVLLSNTLYAQFSPG